MKNLREKDFITVDDDGFISLTASGYDKASKVYERHTILTKWLVSIGVDEETALDDACKIEHDLSDKSFDAIKAQLK